MTPPNKTNKAPITDSQTTEIYQLSDEEFRIILSWNLVNYKNTQVAK